MSLGLLRLERILEKSQKKRMRLASRMRSFSKPLRPGRYFRFKSAHDPAISNISRQFRRAHVFGGAASAGHAACAECPRTKRFEAIIDSGATRCLFHASLATYLGSSLKMGMREVTNGIGGQEEVWLHDLTLYVQGAPVRIKAGFKENLPVGGLLGTVGFFEHFDITFEGAAKRSVMDRIYHA